MKPNNFFTSVFVLFLGAACSKPSSDELKEPEYAFFEVVEFESNAPVSGARVELYSCTFRDFGSGCTSTAISSKLTDAQGMCSFSKSQYKADEGIKIGKVGYWTRSSSGSGKTYLHPEALLTVHIKRQNNYPDSSYMSITIQGEDGNSIDREFKAPIDSLMTIRAFGNGNNNTAWSLFTKKPGFNGSTTLIQGNFSKPLAKMEQGSFTGTATTRRNCL